jgi:hypothetical protein
MGTVKLNVGGVAKYIAAGPAKQRRVLRDYKYPDPQGYAQAGYYRDAQEIIEAYHRGEYENEWLLQRAAELQVQAAAMVGQRSTRLRSNATALRSYATHFGERRLEVLAHVSLRTTIAGVIISAQPDLHVRERNHERIIKLEFAKDQSPEELKVESQLLLQAATAMGLGLAGGDVLCFDCRNGEVYRGPRRAGSRLSADIEAACQTIAAIWDDL